MKRANCVHCKFRNHYQRKPKSLLGRLWRWHIGWCPGWKKFVTSLSVEEKLLIDEELASGS